MNFEELLDHSFNDDLLMLERRPMVRDDILELVFEEGHTSTPSGIRDSKI
jgi:hypothetical protein